MLGRRGGDLTNDVRDTAHTAHDLGHGLTGLAHQAGTVFHPLDRGTDQGFDFLGGLGTAARQAAHLARHDGKTPALLACTGGFHGSIQGQDVGLEGNAIDHPRDVGNLARAGGDLLHGAHHLGHHGAAAPCHFGGRISEIIGMARGFGALLHRAGEQLHGRRCFLQVGRCLFSTVTQVVVSTGDFAAGGGDVACRILHLAHKVTQ